MALASHFIAIRSVHVACVAMSGALFCVRGLLRLREVPLANHRALRILSQAIDTVLLTAAVLLTLIVHQFPLVDAWLTVKVALLVLYIGLGSLALRRARTPRGRAIAYVAALLTFGTIVSVAVTHSPYGWLRLLR